MLVGPDLVKEGRGREAHTQVEKNRTKMGRKGKMVVCFMFFFQSKENLGDFRTIEEKKNNLIIIIIKNLKFLIHNFK